MKSMLGIFFLLMTLQGAEARLPFHRIPHSVCRAERIIIIGPIPEGKEHTPCGSYFYESIEGALVFYADSGEENRLFRFRISKRFIRVEIDNRKAVPTAEFKVDHDYRIIIHISYAEYEKSHCLPRPNSSV